MNFYRKTRISDTSGKAWPGGAARNKVRRMRLAFALAALFALAGAAAAQQGGWRVIEVPQTQAERDAAAGPPRSRAAMLQELAGTFGAVHYFTVACDGRDNQYWRERMIALIEAEASDRYLRAAMIEAFNDQ